MRQADLFNRAADCQRAWDLASDPQERAALMTLRDMWMALANESLTLSDEQLAKEITAIEALQSSVRVGGKAAPK